MKASTLPRYLFGSRKAILEVAASPWSILIGIIFVISAGLAREYDGEDLIHEPWHALRPILASLASGTTLFLVVHLAAMLRLENGEGTPPSFAKAWQTFMGLFWMTAPMAWLYAFPYERFMTPVDAISINLWTLALVSVWRVLLMTRVIHVIYGIGLSSSFFLVMLFADIVVFAVVTLVPTPVIDVMGGIRHSERDALIASVTLLITFLSVVSAPLWFLGAIISACTLKPKWPELHKAISTQQSHGLLILACASVVAFAPLLFISQPEQINRREVELLLEQGEVPKALAVMSGRAQDDYPPHWDPPPKIGYRNSKPSLHEVCDAMANAWPSDWVAQIYLAKIERGLQNELMPSWLSATWTDIANRLEEFDRHNEPDPEKTATAKFLLNHKPNLSDPDRTALERIVKILSAEEKREMPKDEPAAP